MTVKERALRLVEAVPPEQLGEAEKMLRALVPEEEPTATLSPEERMARMRPLLEKHKAGTPLTEEERRELLSLGRGMSAHLPGSVDEFLREKHEENERTEARLAPCQACRRGIGAYTPPKE
jgi:hypothetical protein